MSSLSKRLKQLRLELQLTQKELSDVLDIPKQRIADMEAGKVKNLRGNEIASLEKQYKINPIWLSTGEGEMFINKGTIIGVNHGNISISGSIFDHTDIVKDIIELLKYAPPGYLEIVKAKLEEFKKFSEE
jgi:transcriptional regulator with XRE-family HTH domain